MDKIPKTAVIVCLRDRFANGVKPAELQKYLKKHKYRVTMYDTGSLSRLGKNGLKKHLPDVRNPTKTYLFCLEKIHFMGDVGGPLVGKYFKSYVIQKMIVTRGKIVSKQLKTEQQYDLLICESNLDQAIFNNKRLAKMQILDVPAPFAEELYFGKLLTKRAYEKFRTYEQATYANCDFLSFHWHTYANYVKKTKYNGDNFINISYGTSPKLTTAKYSAKPRIIFLGLLHGYWVNLPLLSKLCQLYTNIDVYGGPKPPARFGINYKGYAPTTAVLKNYQYGLITISEDDLRKNSFSSKHLEYISYGLPVFTPAWRKDTILAKSSIYYTADNFLSKLRQFNTKEAWELKQQSALDESKVLNWENALRALDL